LNCNKQYFDNLQRLFEKSIDESVAIKTSPVAQNRYFLDLVNKKSLMFSEIVDGDYKIPIEVGSDKYFWLLRYSMIIQRTSSIFWSHCFMCFINKQIINFWVI
jgi:hypothetical protein